MTKAAQTRANILQKAFELIYRNGFQATSIDDIIATTRVTKGAFFYHFKNKEDMGLALIAEVLLPGMKQHLMDPLVKADNPAADIYAMMKHLLLEAPFFQVQYGCPAVNLVEEMAGLNQNFKEALLHLISQCQQALEESIRRGQERGTIRPEIDPAQTAGFIMVGYSGARNMGKLYGPAIYQTYLLQLNRYLQQLT